MTNRHALILIAACCSTISVFAMEDEKKQKETCLDLANIRSILEQAKQNVPNTPEKRHAAHITKTLDAVKDARESLEVNTPKKKKSQLTYNDWTPKTDPNTRAFPAILSIIHKPSIEKSKTIPKALVDILRENAVILKEFYDKNPHKKALNDVKKIQKFE